MEAQKNEVGKSPPLKERWDRLDEYESKHTASRHRLENEGWELAKELRERIAAGETQQALADEAGRSQDLVSAYIADYFGPEEERKQAGWPSAVDA
jgi:hypothetical protein